MLGVSARLSLTSSLTFRSFPPPCGNSASDSECHTGRSLKLLFFRLGEADFSYLFYAICNCILTTVY